MKLKLIMKMVGTRRLYNSRMWFFGCTFESDWFDTGSWESLDPPRENPFVQIKQKEKISLTDCHFDQTPNGPTRAYL